MPQGARHGRPGKEQGAEQCSVLKVGRGERRGSALAWAVRTGELLHRAQGPYNYKQECPQPAFRSGRALLTISLFLRKCTPTHTQTASAHPLVHRQSVHTHSYTTSAHPHVHNQYIPMVTPSVHIHAYKQSVHNHMYTENQCTPTRTICAHPYVQSAHTHTHRDN